ncbi:MAG: hypothetical protein Q9168_005275 [Polycauliona sp. 1 TL-2023]
MPQPRSSISHPPQTSRQAKRAYQKAGGTPRISAAEQRRIDRAVELEDRAARIRLHNVRARENKRKKAEKEEKDKELRKKTGKPEPSKFRVGSSQLSLGSFVAVGSKPKSSEPVQHQLAECSPLCTPTERTKTEDISLDCPDMPEMSNPPNPVKIETTAVPSKPFESCCNSPHTVTPQDGIPRQKVGNTTKVPLTTLMPPPPPRMSSKTKVIKPATTPRRALFKPFVAPAAMDSDWDMFLDSNTQVEREISYQPAKPPTRPANQQPTSATTVSPFVPTVDLLAGISTQDLQYCSSPVTPKSNSDEEAEFLGGIEDEDLSDLNVAAFLDFPEEARAAVTPPRPLAPHSRPTAAVSKNSLSKTSQVSVSNAKGKDTPIFSRMDEFDDHDFSSQELRQLVV